MEPRYVHSTMALLVIDIMNKPTVCLKKNILDIFSCNFRKHCLIFKIFGTRVTEKVCNQ